MAGKIFINYRRDDDPGAVQALYARLEDAFKPEQLFMDVENIPAGEDFVEYLEAQVAQCDVLLVVIGKRWLDVRDARGVRRLDHPEDFVRIEIEAALKFGKRIIPVLVNDADMARSDELPETLKPLARRSAVRLTQQRFDADLQELIDGVEKGLKDAVERRMEKEQAVQRVSDEKIRHAAASEQEAKGRAAVSANNSMLFKNFFQSRPSSPRVKETWRRIELLKRKPTRRQAITIFGAAGALGVVGGGYAAWNVFQRDVLIRTFSGHTEAVEDVAFSPDGRTLASASLDRTIKLWNTSTGDLIRSFDADASLRLAVAFSSDSRTLASNGSDYTIKLWDVGTGGLIRSFEDSGASSGEIRSIAFSLDGRMLASGSSYGMVKLLWNAGPGWLVRSNAKAHASVVYSVAFSPDGRTLASGSDDKTIKLWDVGTGQLIRTVDAHTAAVNSIAFSSDGRTLASGSNDKTIKLWDPGTGRLIRSIDTQGDGIESVAFSPDGRTLASGSSAYAFSFSFTDDNIKFWNVDSGELIRYFEYGSHVNSIAFSPDGRMLASGSYDKTVKLWRV